MSEDNSDNIAKTPARADMLHTGMFYASRFKIIRSLGNGAMGKVYLASDLMLSERNIALKILSSDLENDPAHLTRFLREVQLTREVTHPTVVRTYDIGQFGSSHYFTMEYVDGKNLAELTSGKASPSEFCISILTQLAEGLDAIHSKGIVHRDLKSSNVLVTKDNKIKITDFGIARPDVSNLTVPNDLIGSATHMAPEIWKQSADSQSTDLYSLGVILYELITGKLPFAGKTAYALMWEHLKEEPLNPRKYASHTPLWLSDLCLQLLSKDETDRPVSAKKILQIIEYQTKGDLPHHSKRQEPKTELRTEGVKPKERKTNLIIPNVDIWSPAADISKAVNKLSPREPKFTSIFKSQNSTNASVSQSLDLGQYTSDQARRNFGVSSTLTKALIAIVATASVMAIMVVISVLAVSAVYFYSQ